ncbi:MAG: preprotein translocase subunit YajC [Bacteroidales bacterium]|nr:preprotein translocase subunit YajC [Bacteroidales bacterium]
MILLTIANGWKTAIMITLMILVFYFFLIRPQKQEQKKKENYRNSLRKGDEVMTLTGIHGMIYNTDATKVLLEVAPGVRIAVSKDNICPIPTPKAPKR